MAGKKFELAFGALAPPLRTQLREIGVTAPKKETDQWQACATALTTCRLHGLVAPEVTHRGENRLCRRILDWCLENKKLVKVT
jgi:hypothetical protein